MLLDVLSRAVADLENCLTVAHWAWPTYEHFHFVTVEYCLRKKISNENINPGLNYWMNSNKTIGNSNIEINNCL